MTVAGDSVEHRLFWGQIFLVFDSKGACVLYLEGLANLCLPFVLYCEVVDGPLEGFNHGFGSDQFGQIA